MKTIRPFYIVLFFITACLCSSCLKEEDPGPLQQEDKNYSILDFDRLDMGNAFIVTVQQGEVYSVRARGDRRNLDDLSVVKLGTTLKIDYSRNGDRKHTTYIDITLPSLRGGNFSDASNFAITGFNKGDKFDLSLSGASEGQMNGTMKASWITLSGASKLTMSGQSDALVVKASGASDFQAFALNSKDVEAEASGASAIHVSANQSLKATASGASEILYRGKPMLTSSVSGASTVREDN